MSISQIYVIVTTAKNDFKHPLRRSVNDLEQRL